ncbi:ribosomal protein S18-alanine N-acetyltransferase [Peptoniphilus raoultii]|uniref:ribosomal protein S18-alanine N-acetyltransferase n=1 Tax=Peptoniphilus raoultii TaxID=1776387 RepID=UPI0008DB2F4E|nr:ribosomal protein S18-alanine N-acetyltransferase [Peptoniphilus raoultii]
MPIEIRKAFEDDVNAIFNIDKFSFDLPWSKKSIRMLIVEDKLAEILIAALDGKVTSYISYMKIFDEIHIQNVATAPEYRGRGIGSKLLKHLISYADDNNLKITLEVNTKNTRALSLYKKYGFKAVSIRKDYYGIDKDAFIMWRD